MGRHEWQGIDALNAHYAQLKAELGGLAAKGKSPFNNNRANSIWKEMEAIKEDWSGKGLIA